MQPPPLFRLDLPFHLIQAVRVGHAVMEPLVWRVQISHQHADKFELLRERFGARYEVGDSAAPLAPLIRLDHQAPRVSVGLIQRPLVFPQAAFLHCRSSWGERRLRFSFAGLMTPKRVQAIQRWAQRWYPKEAGAASWGPLAAQYQRPVEDRTLKLEVGPAAFWFSGRGRFWPVKAWDDEYFDMVTASEFVLCPNGDFIWTYRFFEAAMCGAIPVVEDTCAHYQGFRYHRFSDDPHSLRWSAADAEHNFETCRKLLTIDADELAQEIMPRLR